MVSLVRRANARRATDWRALRWQRQKRSEMWSNGRKSGNHMKYSKILKYEM